MTDFKTAFAAVLLDLRGVVLGMSPVGSRYILSMEEGADTDVLVLVKDLGDASEMAVKAGYTPDASYTLGTSKFQSLRKDDVNLILTQNSHFYDRFVMATDICKLLKVANKDDRVVIHERLREDTYVPDIFL